MEQIIIGQYISCVFLNTPIIFAYIDPGTGSIILQAVIGVAVGAAVAAKLFWHRILKFLGIRKGNSSKITADESEIKQ